jgi:nuclear transport factor 2 (NTF2) superfamily protein
MPHGCLPRQFGFRACFRRPFLVEAHLYTEGMTDDLLRSIYDSFNRRDIDAVLTKMAPDVDWPNGMEGGRVHGREAVRQYWLRQWSQINPLVQPQNIHTDPTGAIFVEVHQVVHDLAGVLLTERMVQHVYRVENGLIQSMEIRESASKP